ncbi:ATP-binding protein [candidate division KSB1 bacterium]|nr:ATP-binding protein [candidate division KSB1 bacterium]
MRELSLHILDVVTNSIEAAATRIIVFIEESIKHNYFRIRIRDDGRGMSEEMVKTVTDPFVTTRRTRKVGMGLPLLKQLAEACNGNLTITSAIGKGSEICVTMQHDHWNRPPLGDMAETVVNLIVGAPDIHFLYRHSTDAGHFTFDSIWFQARMAERNCTPYQLIGPAKEMIKQQLLQIEAGS